MKYRSIVLILFLIALPIVFFGCCRPPNLGSVGVTLIPQQRDCWCWAAVTEMISDYYGHRVIQCESAEYVHELNYPPPAVQPNCCTGCTGSCNCWGWDWGATIGNIQDNWTHWGFTYKYLASELPWSSDSGDDCKDTLSPTSYCRKSPIMVVWWWYPIGLAGGHVVSAYGYAEIGGQQYIAYMNPWPPDCDEGTPCSSVTGGEDAISTYAAFVDDGVHSWGASFYAFEY